MKVDYSKLDPSMLNKPLSELGITPGEGEKKEDGGIPVTIPEGLLPQEKTEEAKQEPASTEPEGESKVSYSRFKKFHDRALEAEEEAEYWRRKAIEREEAKPQYEPPVPDVQVAPDYDSADYGRFKELFAGQDNENIRRAYKLELERVAGIEARATQRAMEAIERRSLQENEAYRENVSALDQNLEEASEILGRRLTSDEEAAILDILDEWSPKDREGNIVALMPVEKAVELYEAQQARSPRREARNQIAGLSGGSSGGEADTSGASKEYNPRGGWRQVFKR